MISNKHIFKIAIGLIIAVLLFLTVVIIFPDKFINEKNYSEYEDIIFNTDKVITIDISMDGDKWQEMLDTAINEEYYQCDVEVNGEVFRNVGIRPKGNTSLSSIANDPDNDRYSFKLEFDHFIDGQSLYGLDKLALNNSFADATNMKEAIVYDMYRYLDGAASLYNYAEIYVNGEYWGIYLALEAVEESFMLRNYGTENGYLYKPDGMNMGNRDKDGGGGMPAPGADGGKMPDFGNFEMPEGFNPEDFQIPEGMQMPEGMPIPEGIEMPQESSSATGEQKRSERPQGFGEMGGNGGANLNYSDDNLSSYSTIWNGAVTDSTDADHKRVVEALKNISQGTNVEDYLDLDNILKYMAVHSFAVNDDSLSGSMAHNYYLYESGGKLTVIPWDYNLAFGGMGRGNSSDVVNEPIDDSYGSTEFFDCILKNEELKARYHEYYQKLIDEYIYGGMFDATYNRIRTLTDHLVKTDPNSMFTYEEYEKAAEMFYHTVMLRGESVKGQLDGSIPSTTEGQRADSSKFVDSSSINTSVMGSMMGGGGFGGRNDRNNRNNAETPAENSKVPEDFKGMKGNGEQVELPVAENSSEGDKTTESEPPQKVMPQGFNRNANTTNPVSNIIIYIALIAVTLLAVIFIKFSKR